MMPLSEKVAWRRLLMALCAVSLCSTPTLGFSVSAVRARANLRLPGRGVGVSAARRARVSDAGGHSMQVYNSSTPASTRGGKHASPGWSIPWCCGKQSFVTMQSGVSSLTVSFDARVFRLLLVITAVPYGRHGLQVAGV